MTALMHVTDRLESAESADGVLETIVAAKGLGKISPTARQLADWFPSAPAPAIWKANVRIARMAPHIAVTEQHRVTDIRLVGLVRGVASELLAFFPIYRPDDPQALSVVVDLLGLSRDWLEVYRAFGEPKHPITPLVDAWLERPRKAATVDGANAWHKFFNITIPLLSPVTFFVLTLSVINSFQVFAQAYVMTRGGPVNATKTIVYYLFQQGFENFHMGYASALAYVLFVIIVSLTLFQFWFQRRWVHYEL